MRILAICRPDNQRSSTSFTKGAGNEMDQLVGTISDQDGVGSTMVKRGQLCAQTKTTSVRIRRRIKAPQRLQDRVGWAERVDIAAEVDQLTGTQP
jgi:hypothetical protein